MACFHSLLFLFLLTPLLASTRYQTCTRLPTVTLKPGNSDTHCFAAANHTCCLALSANRPAHRTRMGLRTMRTRDRPTGSSSLRFSLSIEAHLVAITRITPTITQLLPLPLLLAAPTADITTTPHGRPRPRHTRSPMTRATHPPARYIRTIRGLSRHTTHTHLRRVLRLWNRSARQLPRFRIRSRVFGVNCTPSASQTCRSTWRWPTACCA